MNTYLNELFRKYNISEKDRHDIMQIYNFLSDDKKKNIINNFENLAFKLSKIEEDLEMEKEFLLWSALNKVEVAIQRYKTEELKNEITIVPVEVEEEITSDIFSVDNLKKANIEVQKAKTKQLKNEIDLQQIKQK